MDVSASDNLAYLRLTLIYICMLKDVRVVVLWSSGGKQYVAFNGVEIVG